MAHLIRGGWPYRHFPNAPFKLNRWSPQAKGLVAWWPFGASRGTSGLIRDLANGRFPMTQFNTPMWVVDGEFGPCLLFDDVQAEYLGIGQAIVSAVPFTFAAWIYTNDVTIAQDIISISDVDDVGGNRFRLIVGGNVVGDPIRANTRTGGVSGTADTTTSVSVNTWHHTAGIFATSTDRRAFIDGGSKGTNAVDLTPINLDNTEIGAIEASSSWFSGRIVDARIYNRALNDAEVYQLYANPWELYQVPRRVYGLSPTIVGQPMMLRGTTVPHIRQWQPQRFGR